MSSFNFGSFSEQKVKNTNFLRAYNIYENVKFTGIDEPKTGTSKNGRAWKSWAFHFECPDGEFVKSIFVPEDNKRPVFKNAQGHDYERPSNHENNLAFLFLVGQYFDPEGLEKLKKNMDKVDGYDTLIALFKKVIATNKNTTSMKLVGRNVEGSVYAEMPQYCGLSKELDEEGKAKWFPVSNSVFGDKVGFTAYELSKKKELESAKPTDMSKKESAPSESSESNEVALEDLLD